MSFNLPIPPGAGIDSNWITTTVDSAAFVEAFADYLRQDFAPFLRASVNRFAPRTVQCRHCNDVVAIDFASRRAHLRQHGIVVRAIAWARRELGS